MTLHRILRRTSDQCAKDSGHYLLLAEGQTVPIVSRKLGISEQSYYRWRKEYGGMKVVHAQRLKDLEKENSRLKKLLAEAELDKAILKEAASGNF